MSSSPKTVPPAFQRASNRFISSLSDEEKKIFDHLTSEKEVWDLVEVLQNEQGSRMALRNMGRLEPFINGMSQYSTVIEVFVQVKPEIMALVWGPLKLLLQLASRFIESFDKLLDAIESIGENLPRFRRFGTIFSYSDQIQQVISLIYEDIMDFYRRALKFFRRRAWKIMFILTWTSFETRFGLILGNLRRHQELVDNEARAEDIEQAHKARQEALKQFEAYQERDRNERMLTIFNWLMPPDIEADKDKFTNKRSPGTGSWLLETKEIKEWIEGKLKGKLIWLTGIPGSGKTILSFSVLEHLEEAKRSTNSSWPVLYFFCGYSHANRNTCLAILRTFIYQIVNQDNDLISYVYREWMNSSHSGSSISKFKNLFFILLEASVTTAEHVYIIIDGLDELPDTERREFLPILKNLRSKSPFNSITRIFVASRNLSDIRAGLSIPKPIEISIEGNNTSDISKYIDCESERVGEQFGLEIRMRELISSSLRTRVDGMFLWVHLIIESLLTQTTIKGIRDTLENLPKGLDQAYERILLRIKSLPPLAQQQANKILEWLTCGFRILKISELEDAFAINPGDLTVDGDNRPFRDSFRFLCGPIIELTGQDTVVFVHFSAKEYLLSRYSGPFIDRLTAHLNISLICITYQCFQCFEPGISDDKAADFVLNGDLRLFVYVQSNWLEHIREFCKLCPDKLQRERLSVLLREFFTKRIASTPPNFLSPQNRGLITQQTYSSEVLARARDFDCLELGTLRIILTRILAYREKLTQKSSALGICDEFVSWCRENNPSIVDRGGQLLRQVLESLLHRTSRPLVPENVEKLRKLYGENLYICQYQFCQSSESFATLAQRQSHEKKHVRPYRCREQGCFFSDRGFTSRSSLRKHMKDYHSTAAAMKNHAILAVKNLRQALIDDKENVEEQSIFSLLNQESAVASATSLREFDLTTDGGTWMDKFSEQTELLDHVLSSGAPPPSIDHLRPASIVMDEVQEIIDSCIYRFPSPGLIVIDDHDKRDVTAAFRQIEIVLRQLSSQLKPWKKLAQSFYIVSQSRSATEQLIFNILHCREQYSNDFERPKGEYTMTISVLEKTRERLAKCYSYIQNAARGNDEEAYSPAAGDMFEQQMQNYLSSPLGCSEPPETLLPSGHTHQFDPHLQRPTQDTVDRLIEIPESQNAITQQESIHKYIWISVDAGTLNQANYIQKLLKANGINWKILTAEQCAAIGRQDTASQRETIQRCGKSQVRRANQLLIMNGIDSSKLTSKDFVRFRNENPIKQKVSIKCFCYLPESHELFIRDPSIIEKSVSHRKNYLSGEPNQYTLYAQSLYLSRAQRFFSLNPEVYVEFLELIAAYQSLSISEPEVIQKVGEYFEDRGQALVDDFEIFRPASHRYHYGNEKMPEFKPKPGLRHATPRVEKKSRYPPFPSFSSFPSWVPPQPAPSTNPFSSPHPSWSLFGDDDDQPLPSSIADIPSSPRHEESPFSFRSLFKDNQPLPSSITDIPPSMFSGPFDTKPMQQGDSLLPVAASEPTGYGLEDDTHLQLDSLGPEDDPFHGIEEDIFGS